MCFVVGVGRMGMKEGVGRILLGVGEFNGHTIGLYGAVPPVSTWPHSDNGGGPELKGRYVNGKVGD